MPESNSLKDRYKNGDRDFSDSNFSHANLSFQLLSQSNFQRSDFSDANLSGATLIDCDFRHANLSFSNLSNADLSRANLSNSNLEGASISTTNLKDALYDNATTFPQGIDPTSLGAINIDVPLPEPAPVIEADAITTPVQQSPPPPKPTALKSHTTPDNSPSPPTKVPSRAPSSSPPPVPIEYRVTPIDTTPSPQSYRASHSSSQTYNYTNASPPTSKTQTAPQRKSRKGLILLVCLALGIGYATSRSLNPTGIGGFEEAANQFESVSFPRRECGDPGPTRPNDFPVTFYPVFIDDTPYNLQAVKQTYCIDAFQNPRANGTRAIQVASFTSRDRAQDFAEFMRDRLGSGDVGQPNTFYR